MTKSECSKGKTSNNVTSISRALGQAEVRSQIGFLLERARDATVESAALHLTGQGLQSLVEKLRSPSDAEAPVVAILETAHLTTALENAALGAWLAANRANLIAREVDLGSEPDLYALQAAVCEGEDSRNAAGRSVRTIASALLGITSQYGDSDEISYFEHAASISLAGPTGFSEPFADDEWVLKGSTRAELITEVAGICCRLLCEDPEFASSCVTFETTSGSWICLEADSEKVLVSTKDIGHQLTLDAGTQAVLDRIGWTEATEAGTELVATVDFKDCPATSQIAALVADTLFDLYAIEDALTLKRTATLC